MRNHCRSKHKVSFEKQETAPKKSRLQKYSSRVRNTYQKYSKLPPVDGSSFHGIVKSIYTNISNRRGYSPPSCPKTVSKCVITFEKTIKETLSIQFKYLLRKDKRFSIFLDDYTSSRNRRIHRFVLNPTPQTNNSTISAKHALVSTANRLI